MIRTVRTLLAVAVAATCISCSVALPDDPRAGSPVSGIQSAELPGNEPTRSQPTGSQGTAVPGPPSTSGQQLTSPAPGPAPTTTGTASSGDGPSGTSPTGTPSSVTGSSDPIDETAPLTMRPTPKTATDPQFTPIADPPAPSAGKLPANATSGQVAAAFAAGYYYRDANGKPYDWTTQVSESATPELLAQLQPMAMDWQLPPGIQSAKVRLIEQRGGSKPTADRIDLIVHSDVRLVSPAGRVSDEANGLLLNIELSRTSAGWKVSKLLGQAN